MPRRAPAAITFDQAAAMVLREALDDKARSQEGLAKVLGITQASVSRRLSNPATRWTVGELEAVGRWLKVDLVDLTRKAVQS